MKKQILKIMVIASILNFLGCNNSTDPSTWSSKKIDSWFEKGEWLNGWTVTPDPSINRKEFAVSYFKNKERWDKALTFLKSTDLSGLEVKRHDIDGDNIYATVSDYITKNEENALFEAHQKYIDVQYVIKGVETIGLTSLSAKKDVTTPYDANRDVELMTVSNAKDLKATPDRFFIFFSNDVHRPGMKADTNSEVRKIVVKVKAN